MSGGDRPRGRAGRGSGIFSSTRFLRLAYYGGAGKNGGEGLTGREAGEGDRLRMDGRRFGSGTPWLGRQGD